MIGNDFPANFAREINRVILPGYTWKGISQWRDGYASFCKLLFVTNWTNARVGTLPIAGNEVYLKSEYKARQDGELPVLVRWLELPADKIPIAEFLCIVLYDKEQLAKEGTSIEGDYGIVTILGQTHHNEEPMAPITAMRNALGVNEGGSGVPLDREAYRRSVAFWDKNAAVKST